MNWDNTFVEKKKSLLKDKTKEEFVEELVSLLKNSVQEAYIFGSFFSDKFDCDSDIDLILICDTNTEFLKRPLEFPKLLELDIPLDIIVYTPKEFDTKKEENDGFWKSVNGNIKKII